MNEAAKQYLRADLQKPGFLKRLLGFLPMVPFDNGREVSSALKRVVWTTGITYEPTDMAQLYYMLEEDGVIVRDGEPPEPAVSLDCTHRSVQKTCLDCHYEIEKRGMAAAVRYRLTKPLSEY